MGVPYRTASGPASSKSACSLAQLVDRPLPEHRFESAYREYHSLLFVPCMVRHRGCGFGKFVLFLFELSWVQHRWTTSKILITRFCYLSNLGDRARELSPSMRISSAVCFRRRLCIVLARHDRHTCTGSLHTAVYIPASGQRPKLQHEIKL